MVDFRVLLVDDFEPWRRFVSNTLQKQRGFQIVLEVSDGLQAVQKAAELYPDLILLDEPFSGLDVGSVLVMRSVIQELAARGKIVLFSSHELEAVERVSSRVIILHRGKVVANDSVERLRTLMALSTLEDIFSELAVEQDTTAVSREIADLIRST